MITRSCSCNNNIFVSFSNFLKHSVELMRLKKLLKETKILLLQLQLRVIMVDLLPGEQED
jgi:hypothetical protein